MVVISLPCAMTARVKQDKTRLPSRCTVQAPQAPRSHPFFVPVSPSTSRNASSSVTRGSTTSRLLFPFTFRLISVHPGGASAFGGALLGTLPSVTATPRATGAATVKPAETAARRRMNSRREEPFSWSGSESAGSSILQSDLRCIILAILGWSLVLQAMTNADFLLTNVESRRFLLKPFNS